MMSPQVLIICPSSLKVPAEYLADIHRQQGWTSEVVTTSAIYNEFGSGAQDLLPWIAASGVSRVLYISCNPETLARDAGILVNQHAFTLAGAGIMNMFPHTHHSEAIALFERTTNGVNP